MEFRRLKVWIDLYCDDTFPWALPPNSLIFFFTGNCQLGKAYQGDCSDASSQEEGERNWNDSVHFPQLWVFFFFRISLRGEWSRQRETVDVHKRTYIRRTRPRFFWVPLTGRRKRTCVVNMKSGPAFIFGGRLKRAESVSDPHVSQLYLPGRVLGWGQLTQRFLQRWAASRLPQTLCV